ncbi:mechanosensitive ion channel domain-containing protein [Gordonia polyisoprenivorans]|uniref:mechanosensitive ion channel domain-containing protein n=1 Tax=Gordonia polyisoprenivorans TaxID=84595 RepID=UPI001AD6D15A|nr:mechanosensitive ion channel domain-containing protein [Gordonia polyisoprenivorans]QTI70522.1 mechanosensitive ion channel [Gordonia polyisoprenivorans]
MSGITGQSWFWPAVVIVVGLPISLILLGELHGALSRRQSAFARPVAWLRGFVIPVLALWLLLREIDGADVDVTFTRIVATVFGFAVIMLLLYGIDAVLFGNPEPGTWRDRMPGIFIDIARLILVVIGLGVLLSTVWGTNIGGLFAALGVTSIVIGLALQGAVGPVIAGLFLLFEQPFKIGDWLETAAASGRVVEVNWRAVHIDTGTGLQIIPNAQLATESFKNLSRTTGARYTTAQTLTFAVNDRPDEVCAMLMAVAAEIATADAAPTVRADAAGEFRVTLPISGPADAGRVKADLCQRVWYAARRHGLHLDEAEYVYPEPPTVTGVRRIAVSLGIPVQSAEPLAAASQMLRHAAGETVQPVGQIPGALLVIIDGTVDLVVDARGETLPVAQLSEGDFLGVTTLTRQPVLTRALAVTQTAVIAIPREVVETAVREHPELARRLGAVIDQRREAAAQARG